MKYRELKVREWFEYDGKLFQKMRQLNGSNAYCFTDGDYAHLEKDSEVRPTTPPRHLSYEYHVLKAKAHLTAAMEELGGIN